MKATDVLQEALDNRPMPGCYKGDPEEPVIKAYAIWFEDFTKKFAVLKEFVAETLRELDEYKETCKILSDKPLMDLIRKARKYGSKSSPYKPLLVKLFSEEKVLLPVGEWLTKNAKTFPEMIEENSQLCKGFIQNCCDCTENCGKEEWVSVEEIQGTFFVKELSLRKRFQDLFDTIPIEMEKVGRKYEVYSIGTKKQWIAWLVKYAQSFDETFPNEQEQAKVSVDRKQLSDILVGHCSGYYHCNRSSYDELKELLEDSDSLSPEEIKDVEASEKEIAEGKCEVFKNAKDLIADLHKGRKKGSVDAEK